MGAFEKSWMNVVLTKLGQHVKGMISVAVIFFLNVYGPVVL